MSSVGISMLSEQGRADGLKSEENKHASRRGQEEEAATESVNQEGGAESPGQIPDLKDTVDEQLDGGVGDADGVEDTVKVVRHETISGPLGEESKSNDDPKTPQVARLGEEGFPPNVGGDGAVELDSSLDFLELVLDEGILAKKREHEKPECN